MGFSEVLTTLVRFIAVVSLSVDACDTYFAHDSCAFPFLFLFADKWQFDICPSYGPRRACLVLAFPTV